VRSARLDDLTWPEVEQAAAEGATLVVPVGSTEQHGPHLPLSTDTDVATALCVRLAERRGDVLVAPAVPYGSAGEHAGFAGTLSIGQEATEMLLVELGRSACDTFARVVFVSGHGGNAGPVGRAVTRLRAEGRDVDVFAAHWEGDPHAGRAETSLQLAITPSRVLLALAEAGDLRPLAEALPLMRAGGVRAVSANGVLGDPCGANAAQGSELLAALVDELSALIAVPNDVVAGAR
jgi:creatinine amidohydrolase